MNQSARVFIIGIIMGDNSKDVRTFYVADFDAACKRVYSLYPNWVSILQLNENEIFDFLKDQN